MGNGKYGYLTPAGNSQKLAKSINLYSKNKKLLKEKIRKGFNSLERFDFYFNLNKYLFCIKKILWKKKIQKITSDYL